MSAQEHDEPAIAYRRESEEHAQALEWAADRIDPGPRAGDSRPEDDPYRYALAAHRGDACNLRFWAKQIRTGTVPGPMSAPQSPQAPGDTHPGLDGAHDGAQRPDGASGIDLRAAIERAERTFLAMGGEAGSTQALRYVLREYGSAVHRALAVDIGEQVRQALGIDGTMGDAMDEAHPFVGRGWCWVCGLSAASPKHATRALADEVAGGGGR